MPVGTSSLVMTSQPGDWVGGGLKWNFSTSVSGIIGSGSPSGMAESVVLADGWIFAAFVTPAAGHTLKVGTVKQAVFSGSTLEHFDATFIQRCDGAAPALTGEMKDQSAPVMRVAPGRTADVGSSAGVAAYAGNMHQTTISEPSAAGPHTIAVYTVDRYGNVSAPAELVVAG